MNLYVLFGNTEFMSDAAYAYNGTCNNGFCNVVEVFPSLEAAKKALVSKIQEAVTNMLETAPNSLDISPLEDAPIEAFLASYNRYGEESEEDETMDDDDFETEFPEIFWSYEETDSRILWLMGRIGECDFETPLLPWLEIQKKTVEEL